MKKLNNKGFSLVELIIVIAIMVILVIAIAPTYLKFVHNSKISTDVQTAQAMVTDISVAIADGSYTGTSTYVALPSKLVGAGNAWKITADAVSGVTKIELTYNSTDYEVFPNPDDSTSGINTLKK